MRALQTPLQPLQYSDCGVDIDAGNALVERLKRVAAPTHGGGVLGGLGGFGALYELPLERFSKPVLVSATDGVGTKLKLAFDLARDDTVGIDLVAMCVNDIIACGAEPLYFLDYFATGALRVTQAEAVVAGIARGCALASCALAGGETAEMPGMYAPGEYDLAGFAVGVVDKSKIIDPSKVAVGDVVLGLQSSGPHSNGYSLIRKVVEISGADLSQPMRVGGHRSDAGTNAGTPAKTLGDARPLGDILLQPTRIYVRSVLRLLAAVGVTGIAHITGGGLLDNLPRVLPQGVVAKIHRPPLPPVFQWIQQNGNIDDAEMLRTFNCGIGMVVMVRAADAERAISLLQQEGETVVSLGRIERNHGDETGKTDPTRADPRVVMVA